MVERFPLTVDGKTFDTTPETSVAAAAMQANAGVTRRSVAGEARAPLCGMGICFECRVTMNGTPHLRSCQTLCQPGMRVESSPEMHDVQIPNKEITERETDVLVVGAGPGGIAASCCAADAGKRVTLLDDNPRAGGQIWRHDSIKMSATYTTAWLERVRRLPIDCIAAAQVVAAYDPRTLVIESAKAITKVHTQQLILATGARERFLPFPGWTLPGVFGAGGLQALVKSGYPIGNRRVIVAGTGPLLFAVAAYLRNRGADICLIAEQTRSSLVRFGASLAWQQPAKLIEALRLKWQLSGIPYRIAWPVRARGAAQLESVELTDGTRHWTEPCEALACGFGLVPNLELPMLVGCAISRGHVGVNERQQTSVSDVYAVGELTGIGGLDKALVEGQIAGWAASDREDRTVRLIRERDKLRHFVQLLDDTFALREDLRSLPDDGTIVCRCEDVTFGRLRSFTNWREAKLQTRCGMGPCQGRVCGPALEFLFGWSNDSLRPPIFPTALANLVLAS
jgi:NADPH-dependent 2,4-dienoyl-CoA reductase/sulfur reductase-like enzyme